MAAHFVRCSIAMVHQMHQITVVTVVLCCVASTLHPLCIPALHSGGILPSRKPRMCRLSHKGGFPFRVGAEHVSFVSGILPLGELWQTPGKGVTSAKSFLRASPLFPATLLRHCTRKRDSDCSFRDTTTGITCFGPPPADRAVLGGSQQGVRLCKTLGM